MRYIALFCLLLLGQASFMFPSFATIEPKNLLQDFTMQEGYSEISQNIAYALIEEKKGIVIDVRTPEEFADGHIEGAINVPNEIITDKTIIEGVENTNTPILLYCRTGRRATQAGANLVKSGYKYVMNFGGVSTWQYGLVQ